MPTFTSGVEPVKVQLNFVPLYLPATISPGPTHSPSTDWKNFLSRSEGPAASLLPGVPAMATSERTADRIARFIKRYPANEQLNNSSSNHDQKWLTHCLFSRISPHRQLRIDPKIGIDFRKVRCGDSYDGQILKT